MNSERVTDIIGYRFKDGGLLSDALTHPSRRVAGKTSPYERLEFLGDRVLGLVMAEILLREFPGESEGDLAKRHAGLVRAETCALIAKAWELDQHLSAAASEFTDGKIQNLATLSDAAEAILGAVYLDSDFETSRDIITRFWSPLLNANLAPPSEPKSELQEWAQSKGLPLPEYREVERTGPVHAPEFVIEVRVKNHGSAKGSGTSRRAAEKMAAEALLSKINAK